MLKASFYKRAGRQMKRRTNLLGLMRAGELLVVFFMFFLGVTVQYAESATPESPNSEEWPRWDYDKLVRAVRTGKSVSECTIAGSDLSNLFIRMSDGDGVRPLAAFGLQLENVMIEGEVKLGEISVPVTVKLTNCVFQGDVSFADTKFLHRLEISGCEFRGEFHVENMTIASRFQVGETVFGRGGRVFFSNLHVQGDMIWDGLTFLSPEQAHCDWISVSQNAYLLNLEFQGPVSFYHSLAEHGFYLTECRFQNGVQPVDFSNVTVKEDFEVVSSRFLGPTNWDYFQARELNLLYKTYFAASVSFVGVIVGKSISFEGSIFDSNVCLRGARISEDLNTNGVSIGRLSGDRSKRLDLLDPGLQLVDTKVSGTFKLANSTISGIIDLEGDEIGDLDITKFNCELGTVSRCKLKDLVVKAFRAGDASEPNFNHMLQFLDRSDFDPQVYLELEDFFKSQGEPVLATDTFLHRNDRFRDERLKGLDRLTQRILGIVSGYGRVPAYSLIPCAVVVLIGTLVFAKGSKMQVTEPKFLGRRYNAFWYSLDVFAPIIDLEAAKVWAPLPGETLRWVCFRVLRILGWLLVPIAIAAFTGFLHT